ncbi:MAG: hypothetical protein JWQ11_3646 [Rhizobacter sp.]|nr:hypothetical protein [Rhizobacter sp.]
MLDPTLLNAIAPLKPVLTALVMPPLPFLLLVVVGAALIPRRRRLGSTIVVASVALIWLGACTGAGDWLARKAAPPAALNAAALGELRSAAHSRIPGRTPVAVVVLGGGLEPYAPEYDGTNLSMWSSERLRYGVWLGRRLDAPVAFSGGVGWAQKKQLEPEADVAARIASADFGRPLKWVENASRDTRENANNTVALLRAAGVERLVLVTHGWHMARALAVFREAAARQGGMQVTAAPMGLAVKSDGTLIDWMPTSEGFTQMRQLTREWLGRLVGA